MLWKMMFAMALAAGIGGAIYLTVTPKSPIKDALKSLSHTDAGGERESPDLGGLGLRSLPTHPYGTAQCRWTGRCSRPLASTWRLWRLRLCR